MIEKLPGADSGASARDESASEKPEAGIDAEIVHERLIELFGDEPDGEGDERQIYCFRLGGGQSPRRARGRTFWYCASSNLLVVEADIDIDEAIDTGEEPGVSIISSGSAFIDRDPRYVSLSEEQAVATKGKAVDEELLFELALALTACAEERASSETVISVATVAIQADFL